ncbi:MBG domain-containing protein [Flavobacterium sp. FlaQc-30]|uniref:MBG domain-containing protein n=1 Tax=Flavobacterium sp. FlaQc-30 TaxID=3374179 RepID=UPI003757EA6E
MKKNYFLLFLLLFTKLLFAQTSTETFETESHNSTSFTDNGVTFNIISRSGQFAVQANFPNTGWNGTANDNRYIDNTITGGPNSSFSIKTTLNLFKVNKFWIYLSNSSLDLNVSGSLIITGKLNGITKFTQAKSTGFATSLGTTNGYTLIDLTNLNGQNYSNIVIDELQITTGGAYTYAALDAFTWVKDSGIILQCLTFSSQPSNSRICAGSNASFSASASNADSYQWQVNMGSGFTNVSNGGPYSGAATQTLTISGAIPEMNGYQYRVVASGSCGPSATSSTAALNVDSAPAITAQPSLSTICAGANTTFSVSASNATAYQWQVDQGAGFTNVSNGAPYSGATTATLTITGATAAMNGYVYRVVATGLCSPAATSNPAPLTFYSAPAITAQPNLSTICTGANTTFSVSASNAAAYQWQVDQGAGFNNISNGGPYSGATTATLTIIGATAEMNGYIYRAVATGLCTLNATSNTAALHVNSAPAITAQPSLSTICTGANTTFSVAASNATAYQWQVDQGAGFNNISNGGPYSGATTATLTIIGATAGMNGYIYRAVATGLCTPNATSNTAALHVNSAPAITAQPSLSTICTGANTTFSVAASNATAYQWQVDDGSGFTNVSNGAPYSGATTATLTITGATAGINGYIYRAVATGLCSPNATSNTAALYLNSAPAITGQPSLSTICAGANTTFSVAASNATAYQWQVNTGSGFTNVSNGAPYSGATTATLTITGATAAMNGYIYRAVATGLCTPAATSNIAALTVNHINVALTKVDVKCYGDLTGQATATATNGTGSYTYSWSPSGGTAATASGLAAGTYTVTVTDGNTCGETKESITITQPSALSATTASTGVSCFGGSNGTASVTVSGGSLGYSYSWAPLGGSTSSISGRPAGDYTCTITDGNRCTLVKTVTISSPAAFSATYTKTDVSCNGGTNGSATINATGATEPYSYTWLSTGGSGKTATGLAAGTYTVLIQDANTCVYPVTVEINQPSLLDATTSQTNVLCNGGATGTATVTASGGKPNSYTYIWSPTGGTAATATGLAIGKYSCLITDGNGCSITKTFDITEPAALSATTSQINATCSTGGQAAVNVVGGTTPYSFAWSNGATTQIVTGLYAGSYTCTITDGNGCTLTRNFLVNTSNTLVAATSQTNILCNGAKTGSASVIPAGAPGPFTYIWAPYGGSRDTASNLTAGNYSVTITSSNGCSIIKTFTITEPSALAVTPSQTNLLCHGAATGSASVNVTGGTGSYTYQWAPTGGSAKTATGLTAGTYTVTITDRNSCKTSQSFTITEPDPIKITINSKNVSCNGQSNGSATATVIGGTGTYTYAWSPSGGTAATASGLSPGNYTVKVTDASNCSTTESVLITEPNVLVASIEAQTDASCNGSKNGTATVAVSGGFGTYTYSWSPSGGTAATATGLSPGTYTATVTDANNCTAKQSFTIGEPAALKVTSTQKNVTCYNGDNGEAAVTISGGIAPYSYKWSNSDSTGPTAKNLVKGDYVCTITDSNNCIIKQNFTIIEPAALKVTSTQKNVTCYNGNNGEATVTISGGIAPYSYKWSNSDSTGPTAQNLVKGDYVCTITDSNNCSVNQNFTIIEPEALKVTSTQKNVTCYNADNGEAAVTISGGIAPYSYKWSNSDSTSPTAQNLVKGDYVCTITDSNNCIVNHTFTITEPAVLKVTSTQKNVTCYNADNGEAAVTISGGIAPYSYKWSNSDSTSQTAQNLVKGDYVCTITDSNNCSVTQNFTITQPSSPIGLITSIPTEFTASSVTLNVNASQNGIDGDLGECTSEIGLVFAAVANPKITDSKIVLGSNPGTFTKTVEGLLGNKVYYVRAYSIGKFGYVNYGNEISFTTQKNILKVVAVSDQTKVYGNAEPKLTYQATGFVNGDSNSIITGLLSRTAGENAGSYPITLGTLSAGANYTIDFKTSDFKITKANQVIEWNQELDFGCNTTDQVQLTASSDSGLPVFYVVENSSIAAIQGGVLKINRAGTTSIKVSQEGDQNHNPAVQITKLIEVNQSGNISQYWEDTLLFDNSTKNYSSFQWYKNGVLIPGATSQYYSEKPLKGTYSVQAKDKDGNVIKFCPITIDGQTFSKAIKLYPNPVRSLSELTIESDYSAEELKDSRINIFDLSGKLVTTINNVSPKVVVTAPSSTGIYVVVLSLANGQHKTINLLVR